MRLQSLGECATPHARGPRVEYVPTYELINQALAQTNIPATTGTWTSELIRASGFYDFAFGIELSQAGSITLLRYLDDAGTIALDAGQSQVLTANTLATLVVQDNKPCASFQVRISNTSGAAASVVKFAALMSAN